LKKDVSWWREKIKGRGCVEDREVEEGKRRGGKYSSEQAQVEEGEADKN